MNPLTLRTIAMQEIYCQTEVRRKTGLSKIVEEHRECVHATRDLKKHLSRFQKRPESTRPILGRSEESHTRRMMNSLAYLNDSDKIPVYHLVEELCDLYISSCKLYVWNDEKKRKYLDPCINFTGIWKNREIPFQTISESYHLNDPEVWGGSFSGIKWKEFDPKHPETFSLANRLVRNIEFILYRVKRESILNVSFLFWSNKSIDKLVQTPHGLATAINLYEVSIGLILFITKFFDIPMKVVHETIDFKLKRMERRLLRGDVK